MDLIENKISVCNSSVFPVFFGQEQSVACLKTPWGLCKVPGNSTFCSNTVWTKNALYLEYRHICGTNLLISHFGKKANKLIPLEWCASL